MTNAPDAETAIADPVEIIKRTETRARDAFLADIEGSELTVLHDDGLYRHLVLRSPGVMYGGVEVITWPGRLTVSGGHGTWTFSRTEDMVEFFRTSSGVTRINPLYWGEKLQGGLVSGNRLAEDYDSDLFLATVAEHVEEFIADCDWPEEAIAELRDAISRDVTDDYNDWTYEQGARDLLSHFEFRDGAHRFRFTDSWEWDLTRPSFHFLWSCWAIVHAIAAYDADKAS